MNASANFTPSCSPAEGWEEWSGGECPLPPSVMVEYRMRCGLVVSRGALAGDLNWHHVGKGGDILAFRRK
jgi:hypothetical protein